MKNYRALKNTNLISVLSILGFVFLIAAFSCREKKGPEKKTAMKEDLKTGKIILPAAERTELYIPKLKGKKVAVVANQTSVLRTKNSNLVHLVDTLLASGIEAVKVFAPEHGFRGRADAGEYVDNAIDKRTGLPIFSLYGKNRNPDLSLLDDVDIVLFDIQDVGGRFYTYISTMSNMMEACAEKNLPMIVLDRPNPNGHYVDGPMLDPKYRSFVGMHPVPLVYGMTIGEYARMVNGEKWLKDDLQCDLTVIPLLNYTHQSRYHLPVRPSPNLPNDKSINLYPSLGFFEGTIINAGRGTEFQFQRYGAPFFPKSDFSYTPKPNFGAKHPKFEGELCYGVDLRDYPWLDRVEISFLVDAYKKTPKDKDFFGKTFTAHVGNTELRKQIEAGWSPEKIRESWQPAVEEFKKTRAKYLLYK